MSKDSPIQNLFQHVKTASRRDIITHVGSWYNLNGQKEFDRALNDGLIKESGYDSYSLAKQLSAKIDPKTGKEEVWRTLPNGVNIKIEDGEDIDDAIDRELKGDGDGEEDEDGDGDEYDPLAEYEAELRGNQGDKPRHTKRGELPKNHQVDESVFKGTKDVAANPADYAKLKISKIHEAEVAFQENLIDEKYDNDMSEEEVLRRKWEHYNQNWNDTDFVYRGVSYIQLQYMLRNGTLDGQDGNSPITLTSNVNCAEFHGDFLIIMPKSKLDIKFPSELLYEQANFDDTSDARVSQFLASGEARSPAGTKIPEGTIVLLKRGAERGPREVYEEEVKDSDMFEYTGVQE